MTGVALVTGADRLILRDWRGREWPWQDGRWHADSRGLEGWARISFCMIRVDPFHPRFIP